MIALVNVAKTNKTETFWDRVERRMEELEITPTELHEMTGTSLTMLRNYRINGTAPKDIARLALFAKALKTTVEYLAPDVAAMLGAATGRKKRLAAFVGDDSPVIERGAQRLHELSAHEQTASRKRASLPQEVGGVDDDSLRELLTESEWSTRLTQDQRLGLVLLIDGADVESWHVRAALELLFGRQAD